MPGSFPAGTSNTVLFATAYAVTANSSGKAWAERANPSYMPVLNDFTAVPQANPLPDNAIHGQSQALSAGGSHVCMGDVSTRTVTTTSAWPPGRPSATPGRRSHPARTGTTKEARYLEQFALGCSMVATELEAAS